MRFSTVTAAAAFAAGVSAYGNSTGPVYATEVVTAYTTYCPEPTTLTHGGKTYTITKATTLTITDCPCTVTKPVNPPKETPAPPKDTPAPPKSSPGAPQPPKGTPVVPAPPAYPTGGPAPAPNGTVPTVPNVPGGSGKPTQPGAPAFTGAANRAMAASGAGLAAVFGLAAYVL